MGCVVQVAACAARSLRTPSQRKWLLLLALTSGFLGLSLVCTELTEIPVSRSRISGYGVRIPTIIAYSLDSQFQQREFPRCEHLSPPGPKEIHRNNIHWQIPSYTNVYLYSAYYDARLHYQGNIYHYVRIIGMAEGRNNETLYCQVWYEDQNPVVLEAIKTEIWVEQWDKDSVLNVYKPFLFSCPIPLNVSESGKIPKAVSLSILPCSRPSTYLSVRTEDYNQHLAGVRKKDFVICVKGMDFREDVSLRFVEWLELNRILGAKKFFVYVYSVHPNITRVLRHYMTRGLLEIIPLTLPGNQPNSPNLRSKFLRTNLWQKRRDELVPYNDCFYRNIYRFQFVLPIDIDEVIIPVSTYKWSDMFREYFVSEPRALQKYASFSVQNAYFFDTFKTENDPEIPKYLHMLRHRTRSANYSQPGHSVKSFVATQNALTVFNHYALQAIYPAMKKDIVLSTNVAQMNHYKTGCSPIIPDCYTNFLRYRQKDSLILKYKKDLRRRVHSVLKILKFL